MKSTLQALLAYLPFITLPYSTTANTPISACLFKSDPLAAAALAAPLWHFDEATCFPSSAITANGSQTPSLPEDLCGTVNGGLDHGCPVQQPKNGDETESTAFPTYVTVQFCEADASWRVAYDVFFQKVCTILFSHQKPCWPQKTFLTSSQDTGHPYDWEWALIKFLPTDNTNTSYTRAGIYLEQDGNHPYTAWSSIPSTFTYSSSSSISSYPNNQTNLDHPKVYFGKWKHSVALVYGDEFANDCVGAIITKSDYHSNDYAFYADTTGYLVNGSVVPASYNYGDADSTPSSFLAGGKYDACGSDFA